MTTIFIVLRREQTNWAGEITTISAAFSNEQEAEEWAWSDQRVRKFGISYDVHEVTLDEYVKKVK